MFYRINLDIPAERLQNSERRIEEVLTGFTLALVEITFMTRNSLEELSNVSVKAISTLFLRNNHGSPEMAAQTAGKYENTVVQFRHSVAALK